MKTKVGLGVCLLAALIGVVKMRGQGPAKETHYHIKSVDILGKKGADVSTSEPVVGLSCLDYGGVSARCYVMTKAE